MTGISVKDVTPRFGASYDLFGNGKTALKVSIGKYAARREHHRQPGRHHQHGHADLDRREQQLHPGLHALEPAEQDLRSTGGDICGTVSAASTSVSRHRSRLFNNDTRFGWGNRAYNWEFSTTIQHQLTPRVGLDVGYFRRMFGNFQITARI